MPRTQSRVGRTLALLAVALVFGIVGFAAWPRQGVAQNSDRKSVASEARSTQERVHMATNLAMSHRALSAVPTWHHDASDLDAERYDGSTNPLAQPPVYHERPQGEWQGMIIDLNVRAECGELTGCGLAMACRGGHCGPCENDSECGPSETCVLDHCVQRINAACHSRFDCAKGELCVLSGYSSDPRGNGQMQAYCLADHGGREQFESEQLVRPGVLEPQELEPAELLESVRASVE